MIKKPFAVLLFSAGIILGRQIEASEAWHVEGSPKVVAQEMQFKNGDAQLAGTLYLPENGDHLPAVVALHGASDATRKAAVYRHLRQGLPAMGLRYSSMIVAEAVILGVLSRVLTTRH